MQCEDVVCYLDNVVNYPNCQYAFVITRAPLQLFKQQNFLLLSKHLLEASSSERTRVRFELNNYWPGYNYLTTKLLNSLADSHSFKNR